MHYGEGDGMRRALCKAVATSALAAVVSLTWVIPALAGTAYSSYSSFTCGSYGYRNRATVETNASGARANTYVGAYPTATRASGWFGVLSRLYNDAGTCVSQDGYRYNDISCQGFSNWTGYRTVRDNYYSYGVSKSWTGGAYHSHATWTSPMQTY